MMDTKTVTLNTEELQELERIHARKTAGRVSGVLFVLGLIVAIGAGLLDFGTAGLAAALALGFGAMAAAMYSAVK